MEKSKIRRLYKKVPQLNILAALLLMVLFLSIFTSSFFSFENAINILRQTAMTMVVAVGMTFVLILGEIDLSVGSIACFIGTVVAGLMRFNGLPVLLAILLGLALGTAMGGLCGLLVARLHLPSFIVTLAMMSTARGLALVYSGGYPITNLPALALYFGRGFVGPIPVPVIIMAVVIALGWCVLALTRFGRYVYAIGGNAECAKLSGIRINKIKIAVFAISGFCAALTGIMLTMRLASSQPTLGDGLEMDAITAAVLGGTLLSGGKGYMAGTIIGGFFLVILGNGLNIMGINSFWQQVIKGIVLVIAVSFYERKDAKR